MKRVVLLLAGLLLVGFSASPALAEVPPLPHAFYGEVEINDGPAPVGTMVEARGDGVLGGTDWNPIEVTEPGGYYGGPGALDPKLVVQGNIEEGTTLTFYVNDESTGQTRKWYSGEVTEVKLSLTTAAPTPPPRGGGGGAPTYYLETDLFRIEKRYRISSEGELRATIQATSEDGMLAITIPKGTIALDKDGKRLKILEVAVDESPPDPPEDCIIGLAYNLTPDGATFDPGMTLSWSYDPESLPENVAEEDLVIACYDEDAAEWVDLLNSVVDTVNNTITASVEHLTTFAIIGVVTPAPPPALAAFTLTSLSISPSEVTLGETVTISLLVANTGGISGSYTVTLKINGVKEADKSVTVAAGGSESVTFSVTGKETDSYTVNVDGLSGSFTVAPVPGEFLVRDLSIAPLNVRPNETVTITVSVTNTHQTSGVYSVVLEINGVKEAEKQVSLGAGSTKEVSFSVTREELGSYSTFINGLSGSFTVTAPAPPLAPEPEINWLLIGGIIAAVVVVGLVVLFVLRRKAA